VPQGLIMLLTRFGANITLAHPKGYKLMDRCLDDANRFSKESGGSFNVTDNMDEAFKGAVAVYPKSWGPYELMLKRVGEKDDSKLKALEKQMLEQNAQYKDWICDERRMGLTEKGDALYMHCLPADIGAEVTPGIMKKHVVNVAKEANKKVYVIMAIWRSARSRTWARRSACKGGGPRRPRAGVTVPVPGAPGTFQGPGASLLDPSGDRGMSEQAIAGSAPVPRSRRREGGSSPRATRGAASRRRWSRSPRPSPSEWSWGSSPRSSGATPAPWSSSRSGARLRRARRAARQDRLAALEHLAKTIAARLRLADVELRTLEER
jgi:hypothetical protein